jgi:hypothetical protein
LLFLSNLFDIDYFCHYLAGMATKTKKKKTAKITRIKPDEALDARKAHKFFNLQSIIEVTGIQTDKVYNNFKGVYNSFTPEEKKRIATCLMIPTVSLFERLGMKVTFSKLDNDAKNNTPQSAPGQPGAVGH